MLYEKYQCLWKADEDVTVRPGRSVTIELEGQDLEQADRMFITGETSLFYQWKNEPDYPQLYRRIDDALDQEHANKDNYCLYFRGRDEDFPIRAFTKVMWPPKLSYLMLHSYTDQWTVGISARAENLVIHEGGYLRMHFEVRFKKPGVSNHAGWGNPDRITTIEIPEGTYDWQHLAGELEIPDEKTTNVFVVLEGLHFSGNVWFEQPTLRSVNGYNLISDFSTYTDDRPQFNWTGQNLSRKEWPSFSVNINGEKVYDGEIFERSHRYSEWEFPIPEGTLKNGKNSITFTLTSDYHDPVPYHFHEIGALTHTKGALQLIAVPENITVGISNPILVRTLEDTIRLDWQSDELTLESPSVLETAGFHILPVKVEKPGTHLKFTLNGIEDSIRRAVIREDDNVVTGTGDMIYVDQNMDDAMEFMSWYLNTHVGNLMTIRPTYRWSGNRILRPEVWKELTRVLNGMHVKYAHMIDGREIPGANVNPSYDMLDGELFLGRQTHERDGAHVYWGPYDFTGDPNIEIYYDMMIRMLQEYPETTNTFVCPENYIAHGDQLNMYRDMTLPADMKIASDHMVEQLVRTRYEATRHTGPSTLFKYFYQAGYSWTGSELMYGPMELVVAAQRGAAACYGSPDLGGHLAVQWSTSPHDIEPRYRRYRLALYVSYMQGLTEINTEEGLWHMEEYYAGHHRHGEACLNHLKQQQDFYRYVSSHTRSGSFYTPIAFLYGRYDGWRAFGRTSVWGRKDFPISDAEKSWDLINYYYPLSVQDSIYIHPCYEGPAGFHTGTPHGNIDIVPIEAASYEPYRMVAMVGYNCAMAEDLDKLEAYVKNGGTLLIGWPQLSTTTWREDVVSLNHEYLQHPFVTAIAGNPHFVSQHVDGRPVEVGTGPVGAEVVIRTDEGLPLITRKAYGAGAVYFVNAKCYAADPAIADRFLAVVDSLTAATLADEPHYIQADDVVQFTAYQQPDGSRHYYLLAIDWFNPKDTPHSAALLLNGASHEVSVPWGAMIKMVVNGSSAAWCESEDGEVLSVDAEGAVVQGIDNCVFHVIVDGKERVVTVDFADEAVQRI